MNIDNCKGKWVFVTGGAKRVGADIVRYFAKQGFNVFIHYNKSKEDAETLRVEIESKYGVVGMIIAGDLSDETVVQGIFAENATDVIVNNAGVFEEHNYRENIRANMDAVKFVNEYGIQSMLRAKKEEGVVFITGDAFLESGGVYSEKLLGYTMSKAWIPEAVSSLGATYGEFGIRVLGIMNGPIEPKPDTPEETIKRIASEINLPRKMLNPWIGGKAVAEAMYFALFMNGVTGSCINVDGGRRWTVLREHV